MAPLLASPDYFGFSQTTRLGEAIIPMDWNSYKKVYRNFEFSISQSMIMTLISHEVLKEWPKSLPENIRNPMAAARKQFAGLWGEYFDDKITSEQLNAECDRMFKEWEKVEGQQNLFRTVIRMYLFSPDTAAKEMDFSRILNSQALVMLFAHLDAFMADSMRSICRVRPEVLKCDKKMEWSDIVSSGSWEKLIDQLIEEYVYNFGWQSVKKRIDFLRKQIGLVIDFSGSDSTLIEDFENIRNVIIHNGGKVSQEYIDRSGHTDLAIGSPIPVALEDVRKVFKATGALGEAIFKAIGKKFYDQDNPFWI